MALASKVHTTFLKVREKKMREVFMNVLWWVRAAMWANVFGAATSQSARHEVASMRIIASPLLEAGATPTIVRRKIEFTPDRK